MEDLEDKKSLKEYMFKEIDIIQDIIKRMAFNSFMIKGWAITLVIVTLLVKGTGYHILIAFIPLIAFWSLDAYFLRQERLYRKLYKWVIKNRLNTNEYLLDMNAQNQERFKDKVPSKFKIMFSETLKWFYVPIVILIVIYALVLLIPKLITKGGG